MIQEKKSKERMSKRNVSQPLAPQGVEASKSRRDHYYVQALTESIFVVRKCLSTEGEPGPDDRIVRSFNGHHDASQYAHDMNDASDHPDSNA